MSDYELWRRRQRMSHVSRKWNSRSLGKGLGLTLGCVGGFSRGG